MDAVGWDTRIVVICAQGLVAAQIVSSLHSIIDEDPLIGPVTILQCLACSRGRTSAYSTGRTPEILPCPVRNRTGCLAPIRRLSLTGAIRCQGYPSGVESIY